MPQRIRVLIVDDSALVRKLLRDVITGDPHMEVIGTASNGVEAIRAVAELEPDVVTMDINMPEMDGITALEYIMRKHPLPVVMLSALAQKGAAATLKALELGAVDFITKPSHYPSAVKELREEVLLKIRTASQARSHITRKHARGRPGKKIAVPGTMSAGEKLVVIGSSAGGPKALAEIMPRFPVDTPAAIIIVQHMPGVFTRSFAGRLNSVSALAVKEAEENEKLQKGSVLIAPGDKDLVVVSDGGGAGRIELMDSQHRVGASPHIDTAMVTAAEVYGDKAIGVIMTGMGSDGAAGMERIKKSKGHTVAQDEESCLVFGMPKVAIKRGCVDWVVSLDLIPEKIMELL
ncbi:MAG: chemotaxis response regulator protein-glutamate methylesterase [Actinomycetota bacterium]|nr:chemotaxis response regulator protein-glutamate methylesterase [Actinomycetota bacterium]MDD5667221.1 chemotaxis response regulator protein-glutamate methylesterase [Actinomycetota bacterium]